MRNLVCFAETAALQSGRVSFSFVDAFGTMAGILSSTGLQQKDEFPPVSAGVDNGRGLITADV